MKPLDINVRVPNVDQLKAHVGRHKVAYSFGAGVAVAGITCLIVRGRYAGFLRSPDGLETVAIRPFSFFSRQTVVTVLVREGRGHPGYPVMCRETGKAWMTQGEAAKSAGTSAVNMSQHLNGRFPDVFGLHYERVAV